MSDKMKTPDVSFRCVETRTGAIGKINWYAALAIGGITSFNNYRAGNNGYIKIEKEMKTNLLIAPETGISFNKRTDLFLNYNLLPKSVAIYSYKLSSLNLGVNYKLHK